MKVLPNLCSCWRIFILDLYRFFILFLITGATHQEPKENPLDSMTEEEKEHEAMKLMNMFERLGQLNAIKPMKVTANGKLVELGKEGDEDDDNED